MKITKKILAILLTVILLFTSVPFGFANAGSSSSIPGVTITASACKSKYSWGDDIYFDVNVKNNTDDVLRNLKVTSTPKNISYFYGAEDPSSAIISVLNPGEEKTVKVAWRSERQSFLVQLFVLPFQAIMDLFFNMGGFDETCRARVGLFKYKFGFDVDIDDQAKEPISLTIDQQDYSTTEINATITGSWESTVGLDNINASVVSDVDDGSNIETPRVVVNGNIWSCDIKLKPGKNTIVFEAFNVDGGKDSKTITINYDIGNMVIPSDDDIVTENDITYHKGVLLIYFKEDTTFEEAKEIVEKYNGDIIGQNNFLKMYQSKFNIENYTSLKSLADEIENEEMVTSVFIDEIIENAAVTVSDPWDSDVSSYDWTDSDVDGSNWGLEAIEMYDVWSEYNDRLQENPTRVGIVDSGFNLNHEDIGDTSDNINVFLMGTYNDAQSDHGSHVLGTVAGSPNNSKGITGVVWNGNVYVASAGIDSRSLSGAMIQDGFTRAVISGAKVVNFSLGRGGITSITEADEAAMSAVEPMVRLLNGGYDFLCVQAAGNDHGKDAALNGWFSSIREGLDISGVTDLSVDELIERTIIVGAVENNFDNSKGYRLAEYSNVGSKVDIVAPGSSIYSCYWNGYGYKSGTSMAAPHITAVASLIWSIDHDFLASEIKEIICDSNSTTRAYGYYHDSRNYKMLNAELAIERAIALADATGVAYGCFVDAATGYAIESGTFDIHKNDANGEIVSSGETFDSNGFRIILPAGKYILEVKVDGYITKYATIIIEPFEEIGYGDIPVSKEISNDQLRVVLSWGEIPSDLDSHLIGYDTLGNRIHLAYYNLVHYKGEDDSGYNDDHETEYYEDEENVITWLDVDDTTSYGPETVTVIDLNEVDSFAYCVHNYSDRHSESNDDRAFALADSQATVDVYKGSNLIASYSVPDNRQGTVWRVFSYENGSISRINEMTFEDSPKNVQ